MKKIVFVIMFFLVIFSLKTICIASNMETIREQEQNLDISDFISEAKSYTKDNFQDIDLEKVYKEALSGNINTEGLIKNVIKLSGTEIKNTLRTIGYIFIIIIVHSIIKSISEGFGNGEVGEITYYVQYILIVTLIMINFSDIIILIKDTVNNLIGFLNTLLPILITLVITTGNIVTASTIQPVLLFVITFLR